jgi:hypothetical protein
MLTYIAFVGWLRVEEEVLIHILKYLANEVEDNITDVVRTC